MGPTCKVCGAECSVLHNGRTLTIQCFACEMYKQTGPYQRHAYEFQFLFCTLTACKDVARPYEPLEQLLKEIRQMVDHSEWAQWRDCPTLRTDPFIQSLFADWCADNGFPLQEQAVRQRLQEAEGR